MSVLCKFRCTAVNKFKVQNPDKSEGEGASVTLTAVFARAEDGSGQDLEENKIFGQWTPSGSLSMGIHNSAAASQFVVGEEYYLEIKPAPRTPRRDYPYLPMDSENVATW